MTYDEYIKQAKKNFWLVAIVTIVVSIVTVIITTIAATGINSKINAARLGDIAKVEECEQSITEDFENVFDLDNCEARVVNNEIRVSYWVDRNFVVNTYSMDKVLLTHSVEVKDGITVFICFIVALCAFAIDIFVALFTFFKLSGEYYM